MKSIISSFRPARRVRARSALRGLSWLCILCGLSAWLVACGGSPFALGGSSATPTPASSPQASSGYPFVRSTVFPNPTTGTTFEPAALVPLAQLVWCRYNAEQVRFWDYGGSSPSTTVPTIVTSWSQAQSELGFTIYLPTRLSADVCLTGAEGNLRDPQGNSFRITYDYYQRTYTNRLILLEQPAPATPTSLQCIATPDSSSQTLESVAPGVTYSSSNPAPHTCTGQHGQTLIQIQAPESSQQLSADFQAFQPNVVFIPSCGCQNTSEHLNRVHF